MLIDFSFQFIPKKKSFQVNEKTLVGVAGFEPAAFPISNRDVITVCFMILVFGLFQKKKSFQVNEKTLVGVAGRPAYSLIR